MAQRQLGVVELSLFAMFAALQLCLLNTVAFNHLFVLVFTGYYNEKTSIF